MNDPSGGDSAGEALPVDEVMSPAELRVVREYLGLTTRWVAEHLDVQERTVHRWESGVSPIPDGVRLQVEAWEADTARTVTAGVTAAQDLPEPTVATYRTDVDYLHHEPTGGWSASWHRAVVARIAQEVIGLRIQYRSQV